MNDKIKALLDYGFSVEVFLRDVASGFHFSEIPEGISAAKNAPAALAEAPAAFAQWIALSDADAVDLENYITTHYGVSPDKVDSAIESVLKVVVELHGLGGLIPHKS